MDWINLKKEKNLYNDIKEYKTIFFLYEFLGDGFNITQDKFINNLNNCKYLNPTWDIKIIRYNYNLVNEFVKKLFPSYYNMFISYKENIQRCDIFRYILMYYYGGIYSDLDVIQKYPFDTFINKIEFPSNKLLDLSWANIIFGITRLKQIDKCKKACKFETIRNNEKEIPYKLSNFFFISKVKNHPIWLDILELAKLRCDKEVKSQYGIIYTTGPDLVTTAVSLNRHKYKDIAILPIKIFNNLMKHQMASSWRTKKLRKCETFIDTT